MIKSESWPLTSVKRLKWLVGGVLPPSVGCTTPVSLWQQMVLVVSVIFRRVIFCVCLRFFFILIVRPSNLLLYRFDQPIVGYELTECNDSESRDGKNRICRHLNQPLSEEDDELERVYQAPKKLERRAKYDVNHNIARREGVRCILCRIHRANDRCSLFRVNLAG